MPELLEFQVQGGREWTPLMLYYRRFTESVLADSLEKTGNPNEAETVLREAVESCEGDRVPRAVVSAVGRQVFAVEAAAKRVALAEFLARRSRYDEAAAELERAYRTRGAHPQAAGRALARRRADVATRLVGVSAIQGRWGEVVRWCAERAKYPLDLRPGPRPIPLPKP